MSNCDDAGGHPLPGDRDWRPSGFTELRVHGVGNTALLWLLDDPEPKQVAGDEIAGFYRSRIDKPLVTDPDRPRPRPSTETSGDAEGDPVTEDRRDRLCWTDVEAYDWGGFNTGGGWKAMWLFLLPFSLTNVAGWLVPGRSKLGQRWVRLLGFGASLFFVTWLGALAIHLVALQCGWQEACYSRQLPFKIYNLGIFDSPSSRVVIALAIPLVVTWILWLWPGRRSQQRYEAQQPEATAEAMTAGAADEQFAAEGGQRAWLRNRSIWSRQSEVQLDSTLHAAAILAALGGCVAWANWRMKEQQLDLYLVVAAGLIVIAAAGVVFGWNPFAASGASIPKNRVAWTRGLIWSALVFMLLVIGTSFVDRGYANVDWADATITGQVSIDDFDGLLADIALVEREADGFSNYMREALFTVNGWVLALPLGGLIVVAARTKKADAKRNRRLWGRCGPIVVSLTGLAMAATLVAGAGLWLEEWLGDRPGEHLSALGIDASDCGSDAACALVAVGEIEDLADLDATLEVLIAESDDVDILPLIVHTVQRIDPRQQTLTQAVVTLPPVYDLAAIGFLVMTVVMLIGIGLLEWSLRRIDATTYPVRQPLQAKQAELFANRSTAEESAWIAKGFTEMRKSPRLTRVHRLFWVPTLFMAAFGLFLLVDGLGFGFDGTEAILDWVSSRASWVFTLARWLITAAIVGVATLVYRSYKPEAQEPFGGMWDILSFLPRHYHPYAVPSYGLRAVPELRGRITELCGAKGEKGTCLVSAHSGGVVISLAAIASLDDEVQQKVGLLTYGSPTGALYGRAYPEYFDTTRLVKDVAQRLGSGPDPAEVGKVRWANLWRFTDWTGGYSFGPARDRYAEHEASGTPHEHPESEAPFVDHVEQLQYDPALDTLDEAKERPFDPVPQAIGHTDYLHDPKHIGAEDPRYQRIRGQLISMLP